MRRAATRSRQELRILRELGADGEVPVTRGLAYLPSGLIEVSVINSLIDRGDLRRTSIDEYSPLIDTVAHDGRVVTLEVTDQGRIAALVVPMSSDEVQ